MTMLFFVNLVRERAGAQGDMDERSITVRVEER